MKIKITTEAGADLPNQFIDYYNISTIGCKVLLGEEEFTDGEDISNQQIFDYVSKTGTLPKTAAINEFRFTEFFEKFLHEGYDVVIHISMSSKLSASCSQAQVAAEKLAPAFSAAQNKAVRVYVIDSLHLSVSIAAQAIRAAEMAEAGNTPEEIIAEVSKMHLKGNSGCFVDKFDYLHKGGRCSSLLMYGASLLKLHIACKVNAEGYLKPYKKYFGKADSFYKKYIDDLLTLHPNYDDTRAFIVYDVKNDAFLDKFEAYVRERATFKEIFRVEVGATISCHVGPNAYGLIFQEK